MAYSHAECCRSQFVSVSKMSAFYRPCSSLNRLVLVLLFSFLSSVLVTPVKPQGNTAVLEISKFKFISKVDNRFLSFAIDSHQLAKHWRNIPLANRTFVSLVQALAPAVLRIGGTAADTLFFESHGPGLADKKSCHTASLNENLTFGKGVPNRYVGKIDDGFGKLDLNVTIFEDDIRKLGIFAQQANVSLVYDLNVLQRRRNGNQDGGWDSRNAKRLLHFMHTNRVPVYGFQLGNEPDSFHHVFNTTVSASELAFDFNGLKDIIARFARYQNALVIGPDVTRLVTKQGRSAQYLRGFLKGLDNDTLDVVSFHQYYFAGNTSTPKDFLNVATMDVLTTEIQHVRQIVARLGVPMQKIWIGETSSAWGGGCVNVSDRFVSTFMWLDKLGQAARNGISVVVKQTLIGGAYGLIRGDVSPTPNYFVSLLHKRLTSTRVLLPKIKANGNLSSVRLYAHCSRHMSGSVTLFGINVGDEDATIKFVPEEQLELQEYLLDAPSLNSTETHLNGNPLKLSNDGSLPELSPSKKTASLITFPKLSIGFWVLDLKHPSCILKV